MRVHFRGNLFTESLSSIERLLWLLCCGFQSSCNSIFLREGESLISHYSEIDFILPIYAKVSRDICVEFYDCSFVCIFLHTCVLYDPPVLSPLLDHPNNVGYEILATVVMKSSIVWDVMPFSPVNVRRFGGTCRLNLQW
jgi:hypothetical protein